VDPAVAVAVDCGPYKGSVAKYALQKKTLNF
jgi:hypothetical protein